MSHPDASLAGKLASSRATVGLPAAFDALPTWTLEQLARTGQLLNLRRGAVAQEDGQADPAVIVVQAGLLCTVQVTRSSTDTVTGFFRPGDLLMSCLQDDRQAASTVHSVTASSVWTWTRRAIREVLAESPLFGVLAVQKLVERQQALQLQHALNRTLPVEALYAHFLWSMSVPMPLSEDRLMTYKISQQMVASYLHVTREELNRRKQLLEKAGYITTIDEGLKLSSTLPVLFA